ncbi:unnamed protein product [Amoebophrya sp. A120]|nr:unnamed protein product [Amoebophrya sp. A120]|eukprot:GSA120T00014234001.1
MRTVATVAVQLLVVFNNNFHDKHLHLCKNSYVLVRAVSVRTSSVKRQKRSKILAGTEKNKLRDKKTGGGPQHQLLKTTSKTQQKSTTSSRATSRTRTRYVEAPLEEQQEGTRLEQDNDVVDVDPATGPRRGPHEEVEEAQQELLDGAAGGALLQVLARGRAPGRVRPAQYVEQVRLQDVESEKSEKEKGLDGILKYDQESSSLQQLYSSPHKLLKTLALPPEKCKFSTWQTEEDFLWGRLEDEDEKGKPGDDVVKQFLEDSLPKYKTCFDEREKPEQDGAAGAATVVLAGEELARNTVHMFYLPKYKSTEQAGEHEKTLPASEVTGLSDEIAREIKKTVSTGFEYGFPGVYPTKVFAKTPMECGLLCEQHPYCQAWARFGTKFEDPKEDSDGKFSLRLQDQKEDNADNSAAQTSPSSEPDFFSYQTALTRSLSKGEASDSGSFNSDAQLCAFFLQNSSSDSSSSSALLDPEGGVTLADWVSIQAAVYDAKDPGAVAFHDSAFCTTKMRAVEKDAEAEKLPLFPKTCCGGRHIKRRRMKSAGDRCVVSVDGKEVLWQELTFDQKSLFLEKKRPCPQGSELQQDLRFENCDLQTRTGKLVTRNFDEFVYHKNEPDWALLHSNFRGVGSKIWPDPQLDAAQSTTSDLAVKRYLGARCSVEVVQNAADELIPFVKKLPQSSEDSNEDRKTATILKKSQIEIQPWLKTFTQVGQELEPNDDGSRTRYLKELWYPKKEKFYAEHILQKEKINLLAPALAEESELGCYHDCLRRGDCVAYQFVYPPTAVYLESQREIEWQEHFLPERSEELQDETETAEQDTETLKIRSPYTRLLAKTPIYREQFLWSKRGECSLYLIKLVRGTTETAAGGDEDAAKEEAEYPQVSFMPRDHEDAASVKNLVEQFFVDSQATNLMGTTKKPGNYVDKMTVCGFKNFEQESRFATEAKLVQNLNLPSIPKFPSGEVLLDGEIAIAGPEEETLQLTLDLEAARELAQKQALDDTSGLPVPTEEGENTEQLVSAEDRIGDGAFADEKAADERLQKLVLIGILAGCGVLVLLAVGIYFSFAGCECCADHSAGDIPTAAPRHSGTSTAGLNSMASGVNHATYGGAQGLGANTSMGVMSVQSYNLASTTMDPARFWAKGLDGADVDFSQPIIPDALAVKPKQRGSKAVSGAAKKTYQQGGGGVAAPGQNNIYNDIVGGLAAGEAPGATTRGNKHCYGGNEDAFLENEFLRQRAAPGAGVEDAFALGRAGTGGDLSGDDSSVGNTSGAPSVGTASNKSTGGHSKAAAKSKSKAKPGTTASAKAALAAKAKAKARFAQAAGKLKAVAASTGGNSTKAGAALQKSNSNAAVLGDHAHGTNLNLAAGLEPRSAAEGGTRRSFLHAAQDFKAGLQTSHPMNKAAPGGLTHAGKAIDHALDPGATDHALEEAAGVVSFDGRASQARFSVAGGAAPG